MTRDRAGLAEEISNLLEEELAAGGFSAASCAVAIDGMEQVSLTVGELQRIDGDGLLIPVDRREPAGADTFFDLASITKVFSAHTLLSLVERGALGLDAPVADVLGEYATGAKRAVTLRHLLTHTSGLPATWSGWRGSVTDRAALAEDLLRMPLAAPPATQWVYSCVGFNTAMLLAERATNEVWADLVRRETLIPLSLESVTFAPLRERTAATEFQPELGRGVVRGIVHDESSWSFGGACANAGLFGTASDLLRVGEAIRAGAGEILGRAMWENQLPRILGRAVGVVGDDGFGVSLGLRIGELGWMGAHGAASRGHTGFTGTSLQLDRDAQATIVLLTNAVHPVRGGGRIRSLRAAVADAVLG